MSCIEQLNDSIHKIIKDNKVESDTPAGKEVKFDSSLISNGMLSDLFHGVKASTSALEAIQAVMGTLGSKLNGVKRIKYENIATYMNATQDVDKVIPYNLALKELFDTQKGEHDKMLKTKDIDDIREISDNGIMNVATARSASVIGRKYLYTLGYRIKSNKDSRLTPLQVEAIYNGVGMEILKDMEKDGLIDITKGQVINDYVREGEDRRDYNEKFITTTVVRPKLESLVSKAEYDKFGDAYKEMLRGTRPIKDTDIASSVMYDIQTMVNAVNTTQIPPHISIPLRTSVSIEEQQQNDYTEQSDTANEARRLFHENPVQINERILPYLGHLATRWQGSSDTFDHFLLGEMDNDSAAMFSSFGVVPEQLYVTDMEDSIQGRNKSKTVPLQDLLENLGSITEGNKSTNLHMLYNYERNARLNMDQSVLNAQGSKYIRHLVGSAEDTIDLHNKEAADHFLDAILDQAGKDLVGVELTSDNLSGKTPNTKLEKLLESYKKNFIDTTDGKRQSNFITNMKTGGNPMILLDTLGGIHDFREGLTNGGQVRTRFNSKPDATASGGSLTMSQAIGTNAQVLELVKSLGFLDGTEATMGDIYKILENRLETILKTVDPETEIDLGDVSAPERRSAGKVADLLAAGIYKNMRDLSKDPTMTFIYNQGKIGAVQTISGTIADKLLTSLRKPEARKYIGQVLGMDTTPTLGELKNIKDLKSKLINELVKKDSVVSFVHTQLTNEIDPYITDRKTTITELYTAATELQKEIKILPAIAVMDGIENTRANRNKYGMPLSKKQNIIHQSDVDGESDLITIEERNNQTTALVNTTHGMDNAILSLAMVRAVRIFKELYPNRPIPGAIPVHDEVISTPEFNVIYEKEYIKAFAEVVSEYSVEGQLLELIKELDPKNPIIAKYETKIADSIEAKQDAMAKFSKEPGKVFGNKKGTHTFNITGTKPTDSNGGGNPKPKAGSTISKVPKQTVSGSKVANNTLRTALFEMAKTSKLIKSFLATNTGVGNSKDGFLFRTGTDFVSLGRVSPITGDNVSLTDNPEQYRSLIEHEIVHSYTAGYIQKQLALPTDNQDSTFRYIEKALNKLEVDYMGNLEGKVSDEALDRLEYVFNSSTDKATKLAELVAILKAEPKIADSIYSYFSIDSRSKEGKGRNLQQGTFSLLANKIVDLVKYITKLIESEPLDQVSTKALVGSIDDIVRKGKRYKDYNYKDARKYEKISGNLRAAGTDGFDPDRNYTTKEAFLPEVITGRALALLNTTTRTLLTENAERAGRSGFNIADALLDANFTMYAEARARILKTYSDTTALQELAHFTKAIKFKGKGLKNKYLSMIHNVNEERNARENAQMTKINNLTRDFTKEGKKELFDMIHKVPLHNFFLQDDNFTSDKEIIAEIGRLTTKLGKENVAMADGAISILVKGEVTKDSIYNVGSKFDPNSKTAADMEMLITLKALQQTGLIPSVVNLRKNHIELYNTMKDNSLANRALTYKLHDMNPRSGQVSLTMMKENYGGSKKFKVISLKDKKRFEYTEASGWKMLVEPTLTKAGVMVKEVNDDVFMEGLGVSNDVTSSDIIVPSYIAEKVDLVESNIVEVDGVYKMILSNENKLAAGLIEDMGSTLIKSAANMIATDDSQVIRNALVEPALTGHISAHDETTGETTDEGSLDILAKIDNDIVDHPWFIKIGSKVEYDKLPQKIKDAYKPIQQEMSKLGGFDKKVSLVRKDIRPWLIGGHSPSMFTNPKLQKLSKLTKELVSGMKIGMIIVNPKKLVLDSASNNAQLSMLGVPTSKILKYGIDIGKSVNQFNTDKNELYRVKLEYLATPTAELKAEYEEKQDSLKKNELYVGYKNGFMSSLSSDILNNNVDTTEGLQADIHKVLNYFLTNKEGEKNTLHNIISTSSKFGINGEDVIDGIGKIIGTLNTDGEVEQYLNGVANRVRDIKNNDDMVNYLSQYTLSPNSEFVKAGTFMNDVIDFTARETYRRHLVDIGTSPEKAVEQAIAFMPDYKENPPVAIKTLSDYGILLFPSFFLRVSQPAVYLLKHKMFNVALEQQVSMMLQSEFGFGIESILGEDLFSRIVSGKIGNNPLDAYSYSSVLPTNVFNF